MHHEKLLDHFRNPRNPGALPPPAVMVEVENPACGDRLRLTGRVVQGLIVETGFQVRGCTASMAAGSAVSVWLKGQTAAAVAAMKRSEIEAAIDLELGGLPAELRHAAALAADGALALARAPDQAPRPSAASP